MAKTFALGLSEMDRWNNSLHHYRTFKTARGAQTQRRMPYRLKSGSKSNRSLDQSFKFPSRCQVYLPKLGKSFVIVTCTACCAYFLINFFLLYWKYETVVNVSIDFPDYPVLPAITVCVENLKKIHDCEDKTPGTGICSAMKALTLNSKRADFKEFLATRDLKEIQSMSPTKQELFVQCSLYNEMKSRDTEICDNSTWVYHEGCNCYSLFNAWYTKPHYKELKDHDSVFSMTLAYKSEDYYNTENKMIANVLIHGKKGIPNSRTPTFEADPGAVSYVGLTVIIVRMLPPPYKTMCHEYNNDKVDGVQVYSEDLCILECSKSYARGLCQCIPNCLQFTETTGKCTTVIDEHKKCCSKIVDHHIACHHRCPQNCRLKLYDITVDSDPGYDFSRLHKKLGEKTSESFNSTKFSRIEINLQAIREVTYQHTPKITPIEILGYVGGYMGIWLGISIPWLYDNIIRGLLSLNRISKFRRKRRSAKSITQFLK